MGFSSLLILVFLSSPAFGDWHADANEFTRTISEREPLPPGSFPELELIAAENNLQEKKRALWRQRCKDGGGTIENSDLPDEDVDRPDPNAHPGLERLRNYEACRCKNGEQVYPLHQATEANRGIQFSAIADQIYEYGPDGMRRPRKRTECESAQDRLMARFAPKSEEQPKAVTPPPPASAPAPAPVTAKPSHVPKQREEVPVATKPAPPIEKVSNPVPKPVAEKPKRPTREEINQAEREKSWESQEKRLAKQCPGGKIANMESMKASYLSTGNYYRGVVICRCDERPFTTSWNTSFGPNAEKTCAKQIAHSRSAKIFERVCGRLGGKPYSGREQTFDFEFCSCDNGFLVNPRKFPSCPTVGQRARWHIFGYPDGVRNPEAETPTEWPTLSMPSLPNLIPELPTIDIPGIFKD